MYVKVGKEHGLAFVNKFDEVSLAAMAIDCNLKHWQLKNVLKHVSCITGCDVSCSPRHLNSFDHDIVVPRTGKYRHKTRTKNGKIEIEVMTFDYQSIADLFVHVVSQLIIEASAKMSDVTELFVIVGGDHGLGAFRLTFRTLVKLNDGRYLKKGVGFSTVVCKKDTAEVFKNTIAETGQLESYYWDS